ncbi:hypothetical protein [Streptomyces sp. NPDC001816]|uniref:hypothetical protein n=1 Tax=Streptomyces sp. NPDC001816 TaxID=3364612 RepID=UPI00369423EF
MQPGRVQLLDPDDPVRLLGFARAGRTLIRAAAGGTPTALQAEGPPLELIRTGT